MYLRRYMLHPNGNNLHISLMKSGYISVWVFRSFCSVYAHYILSIYQLSCFSTFVCSIILVMIFCSRKKAVSLFTT